MLLISRYLLKHVALTAMATSIVLTLIIWLMQSLRLLDMVINGGAPLSLFGLMLLLTVPKLFELILPISLALAIVYSLNKLSNDSELVVMQNAGISPIRLSQGIITLSVLIAFIMLVITGWGAPKANHELDRLSELVKSDYSMGMLRPGVFNTIGDNTTIYIVDRTDLQDLRGVFIHFNKSGEQKASTITAERGGFVVQDGKPYVVIIDGVRQEFNPETGAVERLKFSQYNLDLTSLLAKPADLRFEPDERTLSDLWNVKEGQQGVPYESLISELHARLAKPLLTMAFSFLALVPFMNSYHNRRGRPLRIVAIVAGILFLQIVNLSMSNIAGRSTFGLFLLYGTPLITITVCWFFMYQASWLSRFMIALSRNRKAAVQP